MAKTDFSRYICRPFCSFFREGEKEELACQGALVVESLVRSGRLETETLPDRIETRSRIWMYDAVLKEFVCRGCPFKADGCDFRATGLLPDANPCGGYILLSILIDGETISGSDLEKVCGG